MTLIVSLFQTTRLSLMLPGGTMISSRCRRIWLVVRRRSASIRSINRLIWTSRPA
nr:MAG TPA: hypothetical protein [Caudoviricetes sp.]